MRSLLFQLGSRHFHVAIFRYHLEAHVSRLGLKPYTHDVNQGHRVRRCQRCLQSSLDGWPESVGRRQGRALDDNTATETSGLGTRVVVGAICFAEADPTRLLLRAHEDPQPMVGAQSGKSHSSDVRRGLEPCTGQPAYMTGPTAKVARVSPGNLRGSLLGRRLPPAGCLTTAFVARGSSFPGLGHSAPDCKDYLGDKAKKLHFNGDMSAAGKGSSPIPPWR
mmetsp:Transcript_12739/g.28155  ORF Transcript_12739/g.28155 Transcript_12739/m.28155 type:complete len:221 (+) Transcript_12739:723-1385(+)